MASTSESAVAPAPTLLEAIWQSIVTPGVGKGLAASINASLLTLIATLLGLLATSGYSIHYVVLLVLSTGLLLSVNWYVRMATCGHHEAARRCARASTAAAAGGCVRCGGATRRQQERQLHASS
jgi:hypothetical protein